MKQYFRGVAAIVVVAVITLLSQSGCRENTLANAKIFPSNDTVGLHTDTLPVLTKTYYDGTVTTNNAAIPKAIGIINDPLIGKTNASLCFQVVPYNTPVTFSDTGNIIDSIVAVVPYSGFTYGDKTDSTVTETFQAYRVNDKLDTTYAFPYSAVFGNTPLSSQVTVNLNGLKDSVSINGINYGPHLRLRLNDDFVSEFPVLDTNTVADSFKNHFRGLYITATDTNNTARALPFFSLFTGGTDAYSQAGIVVYYHYKTTPATQLTQYFPFVSSTCVNFNAITHVNSGWLATLYNSSAASDSVVAVQNQPGASIDLKVYNLKSLPQNVVINRAALQLTVRSDNAANDTLYPAVPLLFAKVAGAYGASTNVFDHIGSYSGTLTGGSPLTQTINGQTLTTYTINIPGEIQHDRSLLQDTVHLHIIGNVLELGAYRMLLYGGNPAVDIRYRAKMIVTYTKLH